jgi:hypothetical protein
MLLLDFGRGFHSIENEIGCKGAIIIQLPIPDR